MELIIVNSKSMGKGDDALGIKLMGAFLKKLWVRDSQPDIMVFYNSGVELLDKSMGYLEALHGLEDKGVELLACGTCLQHYGLDSHLDVGHQSNMEEIVNMIEKADKVVTI